MSTAEVRYLKATPRKVIKLEAMGDREPVNHVFEQGDIDVVNAALATRRPLLLRGAPGIGKSQLARAVAQRTGRAFVSVVVDARTESHDLKYRFDAVRRLATAQLQATLQEADPKALDEANFVSPGPLWWAYHWSSAAEQAERGGASMPWRPKKFDPMADGTVILIDEIDKADAAVPNGLLEALGGRRFTVMGRAEAVRQTGVPPLVVITTNEERTLPAAFLRRCWVHQMKPGEPYEGWLFDRGRAHFPDASILSDTVLEKAAALIAKDRTALESRQLTPPGQAEYIDLLGALEALGAQEQKKGETLEQTHLRLLERIAQYVINKHPDPSGAR